MTTTIILLAAVDLLFLIKATGYIVDNIWLWRFGPSIRKHVIHNRAVNKVAEIEARGLVTCVPSSSSSGAPPAAHLANIPKRPWLALRFFPPPSAPVTWTERTREGFRRTLSLTFRTPTLTVLLVALAALVHPERASAKEMAVATWPDGVLFYTAWALSAAMSLFALGASSVIRMSLGELDDHFSDLSVLPRFIENRAGHPTARREGMALYFAAMIAFSIVFYACSYEFLSLADSSAFKFDPDGPQSVLDWIYYSLTVVATATDGSITAIDWASKLIVTFQLSTGPLLLVWFVSLFLAED